MELKTIKKTTKELELEITGEDETIFNPITEILLENKDVEYASYMADHPESKKRRLYIRVNKGDPQDVLKKVVKQLEGEIRDFIESFEAKSKSKK